MNIETLNSPTNVGLKISSCSQIAVSISYVSKRSVKDNLYIVGASYLRPCVIDSYALSTCILTKLLVLVAMFVFILTCKLSFAVHLVSGTGNMLDSEGMANLNLRYITLHTSSKLHPRWITSYTIVQLPRSRAGELSRWLYSTRTFLLSVLSFHIHYFSTANFSKESDRTRSLHVDMLCSRNRVGVGTYLNNLLMAMLFCHENFQITHHCVLHSGKGCSVILVGYKS